MLLKKRFKTWRYLLESSGLFLSAQIVLSVEARLKASSHSADVLLDSCVHLGEGLVQFPGDIISHKTQSQVM